MSTEKTHSRLSPSGSPRWLVCPGSIELIESLNLPDESSQAADEGTAAHRLLEVCLTKDKHPEAYRGKKVNGFLIDHEMVENVGMAFDYIKRIHYDSIGCIYVEVALDIGLVGGGGTADVVIVNSKMDTLHVIDLKYGKGVAVEAKDNSQLRLYDLGAYSKFFKSRGLKPKKIVNHIVQPRCPHPEGPFRKEELAMDELAAFYRSTKKIVQEIEAGTTRLCAGEKQCRWCPAGKALACEAFNRAAVESANQDFDAFIDKKAKVKEATPSKGMTLEQMSTALTRVSLLKMWMNALEDRVFKLMLEGKKIPDFKLVAGRTQRKWADEEKVIALFERLKIDEDTYMPRSLLGIGAAEELIPKDKREKAMKLLTVRADGAPVIAPLSDKRPAIDHATASDDFRHLIDGDDE